MGQKIHLTVVIPSFNNEEVVARNLLSVLSQTREADRIIYLNDASTDQTKDKAQQLLSRVPNAEIRSNTTRQGAMHNLYQSIHSLDPQDVVIIIDGDDWLAHPYVFKHIENIYALGHTWLTYSKYMKFPTCHISDTTLLPPKKIRSNSWQTSHLKTFYAALFQRIAKQDLLHNGEFLKAASDVAMMLPMIEMADENVTFIDDVQYIYNFANPLADGVIHAPLQAQLASQIRGLTPYSTIPHL